VVRRLGERLHRVHADGTGAALVEAALVLPMLLVLVAGVVMTGRVAHAQIAVQSVARETSRTVAVAPSASEGLAAGEARALAVAAGHGLAAGQLGLMIDAGGWERGGVVRVEASYPVGLGGLPLLGSLDITVTARHEQRIELYRSRAEAVP
jgi:hypothetical protein